MRWAIRASNCRHGYRSSASTMLNAERIEVEAPGEDEMHEIPRFGDGMAIEFQLEHIDESTAAIYNRDPKMRERTKIMQFWADKIDELRTPKKPPPRSY
jgi:hypothetical protein